MSATNTTKRQDWNGIGICALIRFMGSKGKDTATIRKTLEGLGLQPGGSTVFIQRKKGEAGESLPELTPAQERELIGSGGTHRTVSKKSKSKAAAKSKGKAAKAAK